MGKWGNGEMARWVVVCSSAPKAGGELGWVGAVTGGSTGSEVGRVDVFKIRERYRCSDETVEKRSKSSTLQRYTEKKKRLKLKLKQKGEDISYLGNNYKSHKWFSA